MKLEDHIRASIYAYPLLYRAKDYASSRLHVLNHLFLVIGNGYEWHADGYLTSGRKEGRKTLPKNYFEMELYEIETDKPQELMEALKKEGLFCYKQNKSRHGGEIVVFQSNTKEEALKYYKKFAKENENRIWSILNKPDLTDYVCFNLRMEHPVNPYPICQYSAIQEILDGKTNSLHQDNFDLVVQPDWLQGCVEIALEAKEYYNTPERYQDNHYYKDKKSWGKFRKEQLRILNEFLDKFNCTKDQHGVMPEE